MKNTEYTRLLTLKGLIDNNQANPAHKKEYMHLLYSNGNITIEQYEAFLKNQNSEEIVKAALTIGGVMIATWLISKLFEE